MCPGVGLLIRVKIRSLRGHLGGRFNGLPTEQHTWQLHGTTPNVGIMSSMLFNLSWLTGVDTATRQQGKKRADHSRHWKINMLSCPLTHS